MKRKRSQKLRSRREGGKRPRDQENVAFFAREGQRAPTE
jgi:hypothetical protein